MKFRNVVALLSISETVLSRSHIEGQSIDANVHRAACLTGQGQSKGACALLQRDVTL